MVVLRNSREESRKPQEAKSFKREEGRKPEEANNFHREEGRKPEEANSFHRGEGSKPQDAKSCNRDEGGQAPGPTGFLEEFLCFCKFFCWFLAHFIQRSRGQKCAESGVYTQI